MFGFFKSNKNNKDMVNAAIRKEFDATIAVARVAPLSKQARVGKGIINALSDFEDKYTKEIFQELTPVERKSFIDNLAKRQNELRLERGDVSLEHIGYSLVSRWVIAVAMRDDQLVKHFDDNMLYFKRAAQSL